jgi:hypothetical protein
MICLSANKGITISKCRGADVVAAADVGQRFVTFLASRKGLGLLVFDELERPPQALAARFGAGATFARTALDKLPLELGQAPSTVNIRRPCGVVVSAHVSARERNPVPLSVMVLRVRKRSRVESVESSDHEHVTGVEGGDGAGELGTVGLRTPRLLAEHLDGIGEGQGVDLRVDALSIRRYPCVAVNHPAIMMATYAMEMPSPVKDMRIR